jgi:hypothetical protein
MKNTADTVPRSLVRAHFDFDFDAVGRLPASVAFVSFGHNTSGWCRKELVDGGFVPSDDFIFDLRQSLGDPLKNDRVIKGEGSSSEKTQLAVLAQANFASVVEAMVGQAFEMLGSADAAAIIIPAGCASGFHRAEVACDVANSICNQYVMSDGSKVFQSQTFKLAQCTSRKDAMSQLGHAWDWASSDPWTDIPIPDEIFGTIGARRSRDASVTIIDLIEFMKGTQLWWLGEMCPGIVKVDSQSPAQSPAQSPSEADDDVESSPPPGSPPPVPSASAPKTLAGDVYRLQAKRVRKDQEAPHDMKPAATTIKPTYLQNDCRLKRNSM